MIFLVREVPVVLKETDLFTRFRDRILRDAQVHGFESFYLLLEADGVLSVHGCEKMEEITDKSIELICSDRILKVQGFELDLLMMQGKDVRIGGRIGSVQVLSKDPDKDDLVG